MYFLGDAFVCTNLSLSYSCYTLFSTTQIKLNITVVFIMVVLFYPITLL